MLGTNVGLAPVPQSGGDEVWSYRIFRRILHRQRKLSQRVNKYVGDRKTKTPENTLI